MNEQETFSFDDNVFEEEVVNEQPKVKEKITEEEEIIVKRKKAQKQEEKKEERRLEEEITKVSGEEPTRKVSKQREQDLVNEIMNEGKEAGTKVTSKLSYESTVTLPSKGILYKEEGIPSTITLRGMTTRDEKVMYASQGADVFKKILRNCIISPEKIDINQLISADEMFLILQLRMATFGDKYNVNVTCPHCGHKDTMEINLSDFETYYLPDDFVEPIDIELPSSGDVLSIRLLRNKDSEFVEKYAKRFSKQFRQNYREVLYTCRMAKYVTKINGEVVDFVDAKAYIEDMPSLDSAKFWTVVNSIMVGVDTTVYTTCASCGEDFDFGMPISGEFFRPTIK